MKHHWLKFSKSIHLEVNINDQVGHRVAAKLMQELPMMDTRLLHPEFIYTYIFMIKKDTDSWMRLAYMNEHNQIYNLNKLTWEQIQEHVDLMNHYIELDENLKGRDHEYPDDLEII